MNPYKNFLFLLPMVAILFTSSLFSPVEADYSDHPWVQIAVLINKIVPFFALLFTLFFVWKMNARMRYLYALPLLYFIYLVFESYYLYGSFLQYPHVFFKNMHLFLLMAIAMFYYRFNEVNLTPIMNIILIALVVKIVLDPGMVSAEAFVNHERGLLAPSVYLLLVPCLYFFNIYIVEFKTSALIKFLILIFFIVFFQHRTVWVSTAGAFIFNFFLLNRQGNLKLKRTLPTVMLLSYFLIFVVLFVISLFPDVVDKIAQEIENIANPKQDSTGTGGWRLLQYQSYWPYVVDHLFQGMRLKGFELPIQFYHPDAGIPFFEDGTGHHFHSFYYDILFYFGLLGVALFLIIMLYPLIVIIRKNLNLDYKQIAIVSFAFSGLIFSISYNLAYYYWGFIGLALAYVEHARRKPLFGETDPAHD